MATSFLVPVTRDELNALATWFDQGWDEHLRQNPEDADGETIRQRDLAKAWLERNCAAV